MSLWKWNNVELEIDMGDVEFQEKYENAFNRMGDTENKLQKTGTLSEFSKNYCKMYFKLYDDIFGVGTAEKMFSGKMNIREVEDSYDSFLAFCSKEVEELNKRRASRMKKYQLKSKR